MKKIVDMDKWDKFYWERMNDLDSDDSWENGQKVSIAIVDEWLDAQPDAEEKRGKWELGKSGCIYFCGNCRYLAFPRETREWRCCPNCGAKMDLGEE